MHDPAKILDFLRETNPVKAAPASTRAEVSYLRPRPKHGRIRNNPCPCMSGKKYKNCCLGKLNQ